MLHCMLLCWFGLWYICIGVLFFFFSSRRRHTRCALVTGVQTCALPICLRRGRVMSAAIFELSVTCHVAAPREIAWKVWTDLKDQWFCPKPWRAEVIEEDLRPGGRSAVRMFGPDGEDKIGRAHV